jgi:DNA modification methylase
MEFKVHNPANLPTIDYRKINPIQGNLKDLKTENYEKLKASILEHGFVIPAFLWKPNKNEDCIIDGESFSIKKGSFYNLDSHQRVRVLIKELAKPYEIPYVLIYAENFKDAKKKLLLISSHYGTITQEGFESFSFDIDVEWIKQMTFFDNLIIDPPNQEVAKDDDFTYSDDVKTQIKLGDIFEIGQHRLMCGDATDRNHVEKLMNGRRAYLIFTDPPYGVSYGSNQAEIQKKSGAFSKSRKNTKIENDNYSAKQLSEKLWGPAFKNYYDFAKDDCSFYLTMCQGGDQMMMMMMMMMMAEKWQIKHELIWMKNAAVFSMGRLDYDYQHEPILFGWKKKHNFYGKGQFLKSVWQINKPHKSDLHPTMKPIALMENAFLNSSKPGDLVCDYFSGSGSTMLAAEQTKRICYGMEIMPVYCQIIINRMLKHDPKLIVKKV